MNIYIINLNSKSKIKIKNETALGSFNTIKQTPKAQGAPLVQLFFGFFHVFSKGWSQAHSFILLFLATYVPMISKVLW